MKKMILVLFVICMVLCPVFVSVAQQEEAKSAGATAPEPASNPQASDAQEWGKVLKLATVGKGEGVEHAYIRQLYYDPSIVEGIKIKIGKKEYDLTYKGDENNDKARTKWAQKTAHLIALHYGVVDPKTGREIRVKIPDNAAYALEKVRDDTLNFSVYVKAEDQSVAGEGDVVFNEKPIYDKDSDGSSPLIFFGDIKDGVASFEYVHTPAVKSV